MSPELLIEQFDVVAEAPGGVQRLRKLILQLAVRGKLVPQNSSDEPARRLLEHVRAEQTRLVERGEISRPLGASHPEVKNAPYAPPGNWCWARLGDLVAVLDSRRIPVKEVDRVARTAGKPISELVPYYGATQQVGWIDDFIFDEELVLLGEDGAPFFREGKQVAFVISGKSWVNNHAHVLRGLAGISNQYLCHVLNVTDFGGLVTGTTRHKLTQGKMVGIPVPLPPLPEQRRIVEKVDQLMSLCDELEERQRRRVQKRDRLNRSALHHLTTAGNDAEVARRWSRIRDNFDVMFDAPETVVRLHQAILELAVRGKLVPQDPSDESASSLLERIEAEKRRLHELGKINNPHGFPAISTAEITGQVIPANWMWARLGTIVERMDSGWSPACPSTPTYSPEQWGVLRTTAVQPLTYWQHEHKLLPDSLDPRPEYEVRVGDLLVTRAGPKNRVGISCVVTETRPKLMISDKIIRCRPIEDHVYPPFLALCLNAGASANYLERKKSGMADSQMNISQSNLAGTPIPLPPLLEQRRIVEKVDQLMALCDELEAKLTRARTRSEHLAASVVHHLTAA